MNTTNIIFCAQIYDDEMLLVIKDIRTTFGDYVHISIDDDRLLFRTDIKNIDNKIEKFLERVKPHIEYGLGQRMWYAISIEEDGIPDLYYLD